MKKHWDVVIIGSGLAGYVAANYLGKGNVDILLVEKGKHFGGRAKTDTINNQYFNMGPHALYKNGKAKGVLEELGIQLQGKAPKVGGLLCNESQNFYAPFSPFGILRTDLLNWRQRLEWIRAIFRLKNIKVDSLENKTFQQWVLQISSAEPIQSLLFTLGRLATYSNEPNNVSAKVIVQHLQFVLGGVLYLDYGWQTIIDQLHNQAITNRVQIQNQTNVKQIKIIENNSFEVHLTNHIIHTKRILYTGNPQELYQLLPKEGTSHTHFLTDLVPIRAATLDIALRELSQPTRLFAMGVDQPFYYSLHSKYAKLSKDGNSHVLHVLKYHQSTEEIDAKIVKQELESFLERIQPGWRNYEITSRFLPNITVNQRLPRIGEECLFKKTETPIPNFFIAGDWASPNLILSEAAITTGKQSAMEILEGLDAN
ncbi:FAD-dependent oxidoreductase [Ornithinibacillus sp. L9]|uniref:FAD-dependent oxidoreductase n=1 Tax=Ornithinibacillus caprae TaxID=2678566 RepID=A0A6N8FMS2_9BACI|nr:FAD-dependent oxidoreductase [Ornithinibacillus caprae]MUK90785.1 FAD-dependent oxidoreductase [Ornithinibacillus caprae]